MILSSGVSSSEFISGIINFLVLSIRQAEELSTTVVPFSANFGAHSREVSPPAENRARSGFKLTASSKPITLYDLFLKEISVPIDFSEATGYNSVIGKLRSSRTFNIILPTIPVAPTTATFILIAYLNLPGFKKPVRFSFKIFQLQIYYSKYNLKP